MSDFIDRAKLRDEALFYADCADVPYAESSRLEDAFMSGVDAVLALLDAETTEEWGSRSGLGRVGRRASREAAAEFGEHFGDEVMKRRVLYGPWLSSEGGEKP